VRKPVDAARIHAFLSALGKRFPHPGRVYLVGGSTIVLEKLRAQTMAIDLTHDVAPPHLGEFIDAIRRLQDELDVNIGEVSPADFIPLPEGHAVRARYVGRYGSLDAYHFDPYSTALSKIDRGTEKDFGDVRAMLRSGLIAWSRLEECYLNIVPRFGRESLKQDPERLRRHFELLRSEFGAGAPPPPPGIPST
jgi:hypothetical protein